MTNGYNEKSFIPTNEDLEKINTLTVSPLTEDELYVFTVAMCNNDIDRDYEKFSTKSLEELALAFVGKTFICDHSMKTSDQKARIFDAWVESVDGKKTRDNEAFCQLKAKAYMIKSDENMPLIKEIEAGIKKEVSVSCSMGRSICSICGKDRRATGCEHINGKSYKGKQAYTILEDVKDAYEVSFVAVPAQREAGVTKAFDLAREDIGMTDIIKALRECDNQLSLSSAQCKAIADKLDELDAEAQLGRDYKKSLSDEVIKLCATAMPEMEIDTFSSVARVMTVQELLSFKKAFTKKNNVKSAARQIKDSADSSSSFEQFKI